MWNCVLLKTNNWKHTTNLHKDNYKNRWVLCLMFNGCHFNLNWMIFFLRFNLHLWFLFCYSTSANAFIGLHAFDLFLTQRTVTTSSIPLLQAIYSYSMKSMNHTIMERMFTIQVVDNIIILEFNKANHASCSIILCFFVEIDDQWIFLLFMNYTVVLNEFFILA